MKLSSQLMLVAAVSAFAFSAQAATMQGATDHSRITNGSTGFIGLTESAGTPRRVDLMAAAGRLQSGEASTLVNGQPNRHPVAAATDASTQSMGAASAPSMESNRAMALRSVATNPASGTPD